MANGQAESTNKTLWKILTKTVEASRAYRTAYIVATHCTPFSLAFGLEAVMPMEFLVPSLRVAVQERLTEEALTERLVDLEQLEETRLHAAYGMKVEKLRQKKWFDRNLKNKDLKEGDLCLMYSVRNTKHKLKYQGMGPY